MNDIQFTQALTKAMPMLTGYSRNLIAEVSDADDLLQHTLLKAWDNRDKFYDTGSFTAWLCAIMRNTFINFIRKEKSTVVSEDWVFDGFTKDDVNDYDIRQAVQSLPFPERELCVWWMHGYSYKELAEAYGIPMGTLKSRVFHVKKLLREKLNR